MSELPRPGVVGRGVRLAVGLLVLWMGWQTVRDTPSFWDGLSPDGGLLVLVVILTVVSSWVINELLVRDWGWRPSLVLGGGLALASVAGLVGWADPLGPPVGVYLWAWSIAFAVLLGPAQLLAATLATPGCEMRSFADLRARLKGQDPRTVACPGGIDMLDGVRVFGRW